MKVQRVMFSLSLVNILYVVWEIPILNLAILLCLTVIGFTKFGFCSLIRDLYITLVYLKIKTFCMYTNTHVELLH